MNPWKQSVLDLSRSVIRFLLWFALVLNLAMFSIFSICFTYHFLRQGWCWCRRVLFTGTW